VGLSLPPPIASGALVLALTAALAGCGGGTTGPPVVATTAAQAAPAAQPATTASAPTVARATTTTPAPRTTVPAPPAARTTTQRAVGSGAATVPATTTPATSASKPAGAPAAAAPAPRPAPKPAGTPIDELADLTLTSRAGPAHYFQQGTVTGTYAGTMAVEARITSQGVLVRFTATLPGGTIVGHALAVAILDSATWPGLRGSGVITGGTGRFAGIHARGLTVTGRAKPDASRARVRLAGTASY